MPAPAFEATKSFRDGCVNLRATLRASGCGRSSIKIQASDDLTTMDARLLAADLIQLADLADAKVAKKAAEEDRRQKYREREISAGRMTFVSFR